MAGGDEGLMPWQIHALADCEKALEAEDMADLCRMATGTGKTRTAAAIIGRAQQAARGGRPVVFAVDRRSLAEQAARSFEACGLRVAMEMGERRSGLLLPRDVTVTTVQTAAARPHDLPATAWLLIVDEAHTGMNSDPHAALIARYKTARRLALTATPYGPDGEQPLVDGKTWRRTCHDYPIDRALDDGALVPIEAVCPELEKTQIKVVKTRGGPAAEGDGDQLVTEANLHAMAKRAVDMPRPLIAFAPSTLVSAQFAELVNKYAAKEICRHVDCYQPEHLDGSALEGFRTGEYEMASNFRIWRYGVDIPSCATVAFLYDLDRVAYEQGVGRVSRWCCQKSLVTTGAECGCGWNKKRAWILDFGGNFAKHEGADLWEVFAPSATPAQRAAMAEQSRKEPGKTAREIAKEVMERPLVERVEVASFRETTGSVGRPLGPLAERLRLVGISPPPLGDGESPATPDQLAQLADGVFLPHERALRDGAWRQVLGKRQAAELLRGLERREQAGRASVQIAVQLDRLKVLDRSAIMVTSEERARELFHHHRPFIRK